MNDTDTAPLEHRMMEAFTGVPVPVDAIRRVALSRVEHRQRSRRTAWMIESAAALLIAVAVIVGVIVVPRLVHTSGAARGSASSHPSPASSAAGVRGCGLPIVVIGAVNTQGFLDTASGRFVSADGGSDAEAYARALQRWVPVTAMQVSLDGSRYAYADENATGSFLHLVDRHQDRVVARGRDAMQILGFVPQGLAYNTASGSGPPATWMLNLATLHATIVGRGLLYNWAGGAALWRVGPSTHDSGIALYRLDLATERETVWLDADAHLGPEPSQTPTMSTEGAVHTSQDDLHRNIGIVGFDDAGHAVVQLGSAGSGSVSATLLLVAPQVVQLMYPPGSNTGDHLSATNAVGGDSAVWLVDAVGSVAVYRDGGAPRIIARIPVPAGGKAQLGGACQ